ncbi:unnamed protein product [Mesocestoides corti]|uniref:Delta-like protein n=1 Tax=Mesocestoides corti TaxID=53468 RepID=A0A0R3UK34_MESCO|nr:unnamed protein product [Mesocestoides corti]
MDTMLYETAGIAWPGSGIDRLQPLLGDVWAKPGEDVVRINPRGEGGEVFPRERGREGGHSVSEREGRGCGAGYARSRRLYTLILEAYDTKPDASVEYLVDRTIHHGILLPTSSSSLEWQPAIIDSETSSYKMALRLTCSPHRFGEDCSRECKPEPDRFTCDKHGHRICASGWSGSDCSQPICRKGCHKTHGRCSVPGECRCANGWKGELCNECITYPGCRHGTCDDAPFTCRYMDYCERHKPCLNGGICKNTNITSQPFQCVCPRGWRGDTCEKKLKACDLNPCKRGHCRENSDGGFECVCEPGWRGDLCDQNIDFCEQNICMNGGTCQDLDGLGFRCICPRGFGGSVCQLRSPCLDSQCVHAHKCTQLATASNGIKHDCVCLPGWTGELCDQNIDDCVDKCLNGGTCHDLIGDYYCTCPDGFSGRNCEINHKCASNPCQNGGICVEVEGGFECVCPEGVTGDFCEHAKRGCDPNPCENQAPCYNLTPHNYFCKCNASFFGRHCEHPRPYCGPQGCSGLVDPCSDHTSPMQIPLLPAVTFNAQSTAVMTGSCGDHGICLRDPQTAEHSCYCENGYTGRFCQQRKDTCAEMRQLCRNHGVCVNGDAGTFHCLCPEGYTGTFCEREKQPCGEQPCRNGGYCQQTEPGVFQCRCAAGWTGRWCHLPNLNPCATSEPCYNGGTCVEDSLSPNGFFCQCTTGWSGQFCQKRSPEYDACRSSKPCRNGGTCISVGKNFRCLCPPGFAGLHCEDDIDECQSNPCQNGGKCRDLVNGFECECPEGFMGADCRHNINECVTHPCAYGATCVDKIGTYECVCPEGRSGRHCEEVSPEVKPKPPSCRFNHRIFDHGERWAWQCETCECVEGSIVCEREFCGYWSCLNAVGADDPYKCRDGEVCHVLTPAAQSPLCLTPPCYARAVCVNATQTARPSLLTPLGLPPALPGCRPNAAFLTNQCARIGVTVARTRLPYGVSVEDFCNAVRALPAMQKMKLSTNGGGLLGMSCFAHKEVSLINLQVFGSEAYRRTLIAITCFEITLSSTDERIRKNDEGKEFVFVQRFAQTIAAAIRQNASTNVTHEEAAGDTHLPSVALMVGAKSHDYYWHTIILGVAEINVETVLVKDDETQVNRRSLVSSTAHNPLLVPLACSLVVAVGALCTLIICVCAHRKHQELLERYSKKPCPENTTAVSIQQPPPTYQPGVIYPTQQQRSVR